MTITLGQAARMTGKSKTTLTRRIRAGQLKAERRLDGSYSVDPTSLASEIAAVMAQKSEPRRRDIGARVVNFDLTINLNSGSEIDMDGVAPGIEHIGPILLKMIDQSKELWNRGEYPTSLLVAIVP